MRGNFIIINLKKVSVFVMIISFIAVLFFVEGKLDSKLKSAVLVHNNIDDLISYTTETNAVTYNLPKTYSSNVQNYSSGSVVHNNEFKSDDGYTFGFVQVIRSDVDLKEAIKNKDLLSKKSINNSYNTENVEINNLDSMVVSYEFTSDSKSKFSATEYFIKIKDGFVKFSFFTPEKEFNGKIEGICRAIVNTITVQ